MAGGCPSSGGAGDTGGDKGLVPWSQCPERRAGGIFGEGFRRIWVTAKGSERVFHVHELQKQNGLKRFYGKVDKTVCRKLRGLRPAMGQLGQEAIQALRVASRLLCTEADPASTSQQLPAGLDCELQGSNPLVCFYLVKSTSPWDRCPRQHHVSHQSP